MNLKTAKHWVFDLDGTLTKPVHDFDALRQQLGLAPTVDILSAVESQQPTKAAEMREIISTWEWEAARQAEPASAVHELLELLTKRGCGLAILTRNLRTIAIETLKQIDCLSYFSGGPILGRESCPPKPSPVGVQHCLTKMGGTAPAVMVGDYIYDLQAGRNAGCFTILKGESCPENWQPFTDLWIPNFEMLCTKLR